jgi:SNF family Na+-dependent transporter
VACGFLSAIVVFSYLGNMAFTSGIPIEDIPMKGTALAFIVFPSILSRIPLGNFWCILFFSILFCKIKKKNI